MSRGNFEFEELKRMRDRFQGSDKIVDQFIRDFVMEMAMRTLRKVKMRTPVNKDQKAITQGQLKRNWQVGKVVKSGDDYVVEIYNNTEYASYVEYGHRTGADLTKWVEGVFMMTISKKEIDREMPKYLERRQKELLQRLLGG